MPIKPGFAIAREKRSPARCAWGAAVMLRAGQTQIFAADGLIAGSAFRASEPAALIAEELHLVLLGLGQRCKSVKCSVQPEIRHDIAKLGPCQLPLQIVEVCQHFCVEDTRYSDG